MGTLENLWTVLVSGSLQLIKGTNTIFLWQVKERINFLHIALIALIFYASFTLISLIISSITFFIRNKYINKKSFYIRSTWTLREFGISFLTIILFPIFLFIMTFCLILFFNYILSLTSGVSQLKINDNFMKALYNIGNNSNINLNLPNRDLFSPPANINEWNIFVQIVVTNLILINLAYFLLNYFQKIIEIVILCMTLPFSSFIRNQTNDLGIYIWFREIFNKLISCILHLFLFYLYVFCIQIIVMEISKIDYIAKYIISFLIVIIAFLTSIFIANMFNTKNKQYSGIIKSINSFKEAMQYNFSIIEKKMKITRNNLYETNESDKINQNKIINDLKEKIKLANNELINDSSSLKKIEIF